MQNVRAQPEEARAIAETEVGGMVRAVPQEQDVAIRLPSAKSGQETALHAIVEGSAIRLSGLAPAQSARR